MEKYLKKIEEIVFKEKYTVSVCVELISMCSLSFNQKLPEILIVYTFSLDKTVSSNKSIWSTY